MPKIFTSKKQKIGELGEGIAEKFLKQKDFKIVERNFCTRNGEIDIVAKRHGTYHFVEVKSVVSLGGIVPVENMTRSKVSKQKAVISEYLRKSGGISDWQADVVFVYLNLKEKSAKIEFIEYAF